MSRTDADRAPADPEVRTPTVLAILVVKDGLRWLRTCLQGLSSQSYPRLGVVAIDNASRDGSGELLVQALGEGRVVSRSEDRGVGGAVNIALEQLSVAQEADYLLVIHDDTALEPDTVEHLVEAATGIEDVGVVGPKVVDWEDPRVLREVGRSTDRFGHPSTPLQDGEFDHGQYDRVIEVLFVSSCAMLISRDVSQRIGELDDRLTSHYEDLDFCWRARLAGYRVVMTPLARVRHAGEALAVRSRSSRHGERYFAERASLASMLKNYSLLTLVWVLPLYALFGLARLAIMMVSRRFDDAWELLSAWGWNVSHLPGTVRRRLRTQSVRRTKDRQVRRFMESAALRLPRWIDEASQILQEQSKVDEDSPEGSFRVRAHAVSLLRLHPVLVGVAAALFVGFFAAWRVLTADDLAGGVLAQFPPASGFLTELVDAVRTTRLGGAQAASPALGALGGAAWLAFGDASLAQRAMLVGLPLVGAAMVYRAASRQTSERIGATVAAGCYALSAIMLGAFSQGRIDLLVVLAALPILIERSGAAFGREETQSPRRLAAGIGVALAICLAFSPGVILPAAVVMIVLALAAPVRGRGLPTAMLGLAMGLVLVFPLIPEIVSDPGAGLSSLIGNASFSAILRTSFAGEPGSWILSWFLPVGAFLSLAIVTSENRARANRLALLWLAGILLCWLSAAGYLPSAVSNPLAYLALVAVAEVFLIAFGVQGLVTSVGSESFGSRQVLAGALTFVLALGLLLQSFAAITASWSILEGLPPAWPVIASRKAGEFRVLWIGRRSGRAFPAPGGDPRRLLAAGADSLRWAITDRDGVSSLDIGRGDFGPGYDQLNEVLAEITNGATEHAGAMLAPFGIRYLVAEAGDVPDPVVRRLDRQLDLDLVPALGLTIYRNSRPLPPAAALHPDEAFLAASRAGDLGQTAALAPTQAAALRADAGGWEGEGPDGAAVFLGDQYASGWRLDGRGPPPQRSFGWANLFPPAQSGGGQITVRFAEQLPRTVEMIVLGLFWLAALWITRKPVSS